MVFRSPPHFLCPIAIPVTDVSREVVMRNPNPMVIACPVLSGHSYYHVCFAALRLIFFEANATKRGVQ
jgi:hypothetical protein